MRIILIIMAIVCLGGCDKKDASIYHNIIFKEICDIARDKYLPFCIVLIDSSQHLSQEYYSRLQTRYKFLTQQAIYNMADINVSVNEWYIKWLCPVTTPLTCVFSPEGDLVDLIPGATRETFLYSKEAINNLGPTDFHWPNYFHRNKKELIPLLNNLLEQKEILNQGVYLSSGFSELVDSLNYPYSIYLKLAGELMMHDIITSQITAKSLLEFETPFSLDLYKNEFITAKKVLDPAFDVADEPSIRIDKDLILLPNCIKNQTIPIEFPVYNDGNKPLVISKIYMSCSCLKKVIDLDGSIIGANDSVVVQFKFTPDIEGEVSRDIFITSNSVNTPILHVNILASVVSDSKNN